MHIFTLSFMTYTYTSTPFHCLMLGCWNEILTLLQAPLFAGFFLSLFFFFTNILSPSSTLLCCLSLGVCLAPISLSLPYSCPIVLFIPQITLYFHLSWIPWSLCDPYASPLPCVLLLLISSISYSSCLVYISNPSLYALLVSVLLIFHRLLIYPLPCLLLISKPRL